MKFQRKVRILTIKSWFDAGLGLTNILKYPLGFFALSSMNVLWTMIFTFSYLIFCFVLGWAYFKYDWMKAQIEVSNRYNLFVEEMRERFKNKKNIR